ncbi:MAG: hypothetical protein Ct9H300mP12_15420 [Acidimicrobiales bacterium]|nr:MAG: hypothetical protein Ct9H300mP12_15420 [Acidimicrobiales bacterium]
MTYVAFGLCAVASLGVLIRRTPWWDVTAHAAAEVGTVFCGRVSDHRVHLGTTGMEHLVGVGRRPAHDHLVFFPLCSPDT